MTTINGTKNLGDFEYQKFRQDSTSKPAIAVTNPDGTDIGGGSGTAAYSNAAGVDKKGLVDADRHVQTDVLSVAGTVTIAGDVTSNGGNIATQTTLSAIETAISSLAVESGGNLEGARNSLTTLEGAVVTDGVAATSQAFLVAGQDGTNTQTLSTNSSGHVNIADGGNSITVDGTVAATQSGTWTEANSAAIKTAVEIMDDWDESDRAKVNPIVGQAGVAAGAGTTSSTTQRVVIASDQASAIASESTMTAINGKLPDFSGTWGYAAGTNGTVVLSGSKRVLQITATALEASGTITINGGDTITLPYGGTDKVSTSLTIAPVANLTDPTIVFSSGVDSYFIEHLT